MRREGEKHFNELTSADSKSKATSGRFLRLDDDGYDRGYTGRGKTLEGEAISEWLTKTPERRIGES